MDYLRSGFIHIAGLSLRETQELETEALFYQLTDLIQLLRPPQYFIFAIGGKDNGNTWNSVERFDSQNNGWIECPSMGARRNSAGNHSTHLLSFISSMHTLKIFDWSQNLICVLIDTLAIVICGFNKTQLIYHCTLTID